MIHSPHTTSPDVTDPLAGLAPDADDHAVAAALATAAGQRLLEIRAEVGHADAKALRSVGDQGAQDLLATYLGKLRRDDAVLSEEAKDDPARLQAARVWIIDPLDGTREFSEPGRNDWAVHVALWVDGELAVGAVALPERGLTLATPDVAQPRPNRGRRRVVVSRTRPPREAAAVAAALDAELVPLGSAGAKVCAVVLGEVDVYVHSGGQYEWDSAAPVAVARAAGLHTSRLDGTALTYNRADPYLPDLLVCRRELAEEILSVIAGIALLSYQLQPNSHAGLLL